MMPMEGGIHGVEDILLGFGPKDAGSIPAGSALHVSRFPLQTPVLSENI
jgi:hypothetical protein